MTVYFFLNILNKKTFSLPLRSATAAAAPRARFAFAIRPPHDEITCYVGDHNTLLTRRPASKKYEGVC